MPNSSLHVTPTTRAAASATDDTRSTVGIRNAHHLKADIWASYWRSTARSRRARTAPRYPYARITAAADTVSLVWPIVSATRSRTRVWAAIWRRCTQRMNGRSSRCRTSTSSVSCQL